MLANSGKLSLQSGVLCQWFELHPARELRANKEIFVAVRRRSQLSITRRYMSVDVDHGAAYGSTLTWTDKDNPRPGAQLIEIQKDLDLARFNKMFVDLMKAPTPPAH